MSYVEMKQNLLNQLHALDKKKYAAEISDWTTLKTQAEEELGRVKLSSKIISIIAYVLLAFTGVISFMKVLHIGNTPDLNDGALLILLTVTNAVTLIRQKVKIGQLEKEVLLLAFKEQTEKLTAEAEEVGY